MDGVARAAAHFSVLLQRGGEITLDRMKEAMFDEDLLKRILIIEFGDERSVFEGLVPEAYLYRGKVLRADEVGLDLM